MNRRLAWLSGSALILLICAPTVASAQGAWCARLSGGGENCGFASYEQCRASVNGVGGTCVPNPRSRGVRLPGPGMMPGLPGMLPGMGMPFPDRNASTTRGTRGWDEEEKYERRYEERRRELGEKKKRELEYERERERRRELSEKQKRQQEYERERERRRIEEEKERREAEQRRGKRPVAGTPAKDTSGVKESSPVKDTSPIKDASPVKEPPAALAREPAAPAGTAKPTQNPPELASAPPSPAISAPATPYKQPAPAAAVAPPAPAVTTPAVSAPAALPKPAETATAPQVIEPGPTTVRAPDPAVTPAPAAPAPAATIAAAPPAATSPTAPASPPATDVNISDVDTSAAPSLSSEDTRRVQIALKGRGFDPGPIDGVLSPQTQQALQKFQTTYGINARGVVDSQTLLALGEAELASRAR